MPKLIINAFDERKEFRINRAKIITPLYSTKLKAKQVHSPSTALFVAATQTLGYEFILYNPLIECDSMGDVTIYTDKPYSQILISEDHAKHADEYQINKLNLKTLESKMKIGATLDEVWKYEEIKSKVETGKILRKNNFYKVIGGVK